LECAFAVCLEEDSVFAKEAREGPGLGLVSLVAGYEGPDESGPELFTRVSVFCEGVCGWGYQGVVDDCCELGVDGSDLIVFVFWAVIWQRVRQEWWRLSKEDLDGFIALVGWEMDIWDPRFVQDQGARRA